MSSPLIVREHTFEGQHIREYPAALANSQEDVVTLHAKSYTPREVASGAATGDLTILGFHANGMHKELYEPLFEALYHSLKESHGVVVSSIWIADHSTQGESARLNEDVLGNDVSWFDHSRDVLAMVNTFRSQMKRPLVAVGHSMGGAQAVAAATFHPRLFEALVLIDPAISRGYAKTTPLMIRFLLNKPEGFRSRQEAEEYTRKNPFFKSWEPRVVQRYIETAFYSPRPDELKSTTPAHLELAGIARPNPEHVAVRRPTSETQRYTHPDVDWRAQLTGPVYNPFTRRAFTYLPTLRAPTFFLVGKGSQIVPPEDLEARTKATGIAPGGSGGVEAGNVLQKQIPGGHFLCFTNVQQTAETAAEWIQERILRWREQEQAFAKEWNEKTVEEKKKLEPRVEKMLKQWDGKVWENPKFEVLVPSKL